MKSSTSLQDIFELLAENLTKLNICNNIIERKEVILKTNFNVNLDFTDFDRYVQQPYFFFDAWSFKHLYNKVFTAEIKDTFFVIDTIQSSDDYIELSDQFLLKYAYEPETDELLTFIHEHARDTGKSIYDYFEGCISDNDSLQLNRNFHIKAIDIVSINNNTRNIAYHGSFFTDDVGFEYIHHLYTILEITCSKTKKPFYKELLLEAYSLMQEGNYKMAYFVAYTAFENFVNVKSGEALEAKRLSDKFKDAYNKHPNIQNFSSHESYRQLINNIDYYTHIRNSIAHGQDNQHIWNDECNVKIATEMYIYTSICIICYEKGLRNFKELKKYLAK